MISSPLQTVAPATSQHPAAPARSSLHPLLLAPLTLCGLAATGCSGAASTAAITTPPVTTPAAQIATPALTTTPALNGAVIVSLTDITPNATIYYTLDGSTPSSTATQYIAPFLVAANVSVKAIGHLSGDTDSAIASQSVSTSIASGTLVWADEFTNNTSANAQPDPTVWGYDTGGGGWGNAELENYCAWGSSTAPCSTTSPSAYVGTDNALHIVAQQTSPGVYTSARLKTQGLFSFQYGRLEFRAQMPEAQGFWPAAWMLGNNIATVNWPACGEMDVMERVNAATTPDFNEGSIHGPGFTGSSLGTRYSFPTGVTAATWHTYGVIWKPGSVAYYIDDPTNIYVTYTPTNLPAGATWPFDAGQSNFIILNLAIGGNYPGAPTPSTLFPSEMIVDYVRLYTY